MKSCCNKPLGHFYLGFFYWAQRHESRTTHTTCKSAMIVLFIAHTQGTCWDWYAVSTPCC